jgi:protein-tyrosine phosphatase
MKVKVLLVCMGNICRSPTAEAVFRTRAENANLANRLLVDSAGTHDYHIGNAPDLRAQRAAKQRGYDMSGLRGRQVSVEDFSRFDYILAMDKANLGILEKLCPGDTQCHLGLFMEFSERYLDSEVPDPYYGERDGFELVLDMVEDASDGFIKQIM